MTRVRLCSRGAIDPSPPNSDHSKGLIVVFINSISESKSGIGPEGLATECSGPEQAPNPWCRRDFASIGRFRILRRRILARIDHSHEVSNVVFTRDRQFIMKLIPASLSHLVPREKPRNSKSEHEERTQAESEPAAFELGTLTTERRAGHRSTPYLARIALADAVPLAYVPLGHAVSAPKGRGSPSPGQRPGETARAMIPSSGQRPNSLPGELLARWAGCCVSASPGPQGVALGWVNQGPSAQRQMCHLRNIGGMRPIHGHVRVLCSQTHPTDS